ncbi:MAG: hypothetical protein KC593_07240 [Myxococcales bacterium]|nr:hypothetical protein [Myxococcales bacterium]MCB9627953.1 hypothetical protein [Sandaracinaceae bacterium]
MSRKDRLRSLVRRVGDQAQRTLTSGPVTAARKLLTDVAQRQARVPDEALTRVIAHAEGVREASVSCQEGRVRIDATFDDGAHVELGLVPWDVRFAPRGAKEIVFRVEPASMGRERHVPELVAAVAAVVAHTLWSVALGGAAPDGRGVFVDKEADDLFRVDLRSVPALRARMTTGSVAAMVEALALGGLQAEDGALSLTLELPGLTR